MSEKTLKPKVVVIQGPTGAGKSAVALGLAGMLPVEIVNADSLQLYRYMDIGTATPEPAALRAVAHHLYSIFNPDEACNAAVFMRAGRAAVDGIVERGHVAVVVGGTGLYVRALLGGMFAAPEPDREVRRRLEACDTADLSAQLRGSDPEAAARINPNDRVRIIRALEVLQQTGKPISAHQHGHGFKEGPYESLRICVTLERDELYRRINRRVEQMLKRGLVDEVRSLMAMGYDARLKPMQSIGYRQVLEHLQGRLGYDEAVAKIQQETRRFAKRQLTWLRREAGLIWITLPHQERAILPLVQKFLE